jgi:hypothetical protein
MPSSMYDGPCENAHRAAARTTSIAHRSLRILRQEPVANVGLGDLVECQPRRGA